MVVSSSSDIKEALPQEPPPAGAAIELPKLVRDTNARQPKVTIRARSLLAVSAAKATAWASQTLGKGAGTSLPGKIALAMDAKLLGNMAEQLPLGCWAVTGTNGKTTTAGLLAAFLREAGLHIVHNELGANLYAGIVNALALQTSASGQLRGDLGLLEVDEASLGKVAQELPLQGIVVTNLFRDQLDRYGELDTTSKLIAKGFPHAARWIALNADDPLVSSLQAKLKPQQALLTFGMASLAWENSPPDEEALACVPFPQEVTDCPQCGAPLYYSTHFYAHLGHYQCQACGYERPKPRFAVHVSALSSQGATLDFEDTHQALAPFQLHSPLPGAYNLYNVIAAALLARLQGVTPEQMQTALTQYHGVFGRAEKRVIHGKPVRVLLIKNPAGASQVLKLVAADPKARLVIGINDNYADGRDISWLWDATFELLAAPSLRDKAMVVTGQRAEDMAVRLRYAGVPESSIQVEPDLKAAIKAGLAATQADETLYVLPTYTVLLSLRTLWDVL